MKSVRKDNMATTPTEKKSLGRKILDGFTLTGSSLTATHTLKHTAIFLAVGFVLFLLTNSLIGDIVKSAADYTMPKWFWALVVGCGWTYYYAEYLFDKCFVWIGVKYGAVVTGGIFNTSGVEELGCGLQGLPFGSEILQTYDVTTPMIQEEPCATFTDMNKAPFEIKYYYTLTPLRGYLVNLYKKGVEAGKKYFAVKFHQRTEELFRTKDGEVAAQKLAEFSEEFANYAFGGPNVNVPEEMDSGLSTGSQLQIKSVDLPQALRESREKQAAAKAGKATIEAMVEIGVNADLAYMGQNNVQGATLLIIPDLANLGEHAAPLAAEALKKLGGKKTT
jgi:hypothetical protein